jgi:putative aldouronate transport system permease protein
MKEDLAFKWASRIITIIILTVCLMPFVLLLVVSVTDEISIGLKGYSFFPVKLSLDAYAYISKRSSQMLSAYGISLLVTAVGTLICMTMSVLFAYPLSRRDYPARKIQMIYLLVTMLFNGGLVPTYLMYTQIFHIRDSLFALLVPNLLFNGFYVILLRTYFMTSLPPELIESAKIDGAGESRTFLRIVLPLSTPIVATVSLFVALAYWNDWINGLYYITNTKLFSLQVLLNRILQDAQFLKNASSMSAEAARAVANIKLPTTTIRMAIAIISLAPMLVIFLSMQKYFTKGILIGAMKG